MKKVYVLVETQREAERSAWELAQMLEECTMIRAYKYEKIGTVRTDNVIVKFKNKQYKMDGLVCDVPVGFGNLGKHMARGREYPELNSLKDIAKYIIDEEDRANE